MVVFSLLKAAGLHPTAEQIEMFAYHLPDTTLSNLIVSRNSYIAFLKRSVCQTVTGWPCGHEWIVCFCEVAVYEVYLESGNFLSKSFGTFVLRNFLSISGREGYGGSLLASGGSELSRPFWKSVNGFKWLSFIDLSTLFMPS